MIAVLNINFYFINFYLFFTLLCWKMLNLRIYFDLFSAHYYENNSLEYISRTFQILTLQYNSHPYKSYYNKIHLEIGGRCVGMGKEGPSHQ